MISKVKLLFFVFTLTVVGVLILKNSFPSNNVGLAETDLDEAKHQIEPPEVKKTNESDFDIGASDKLKTIENKPNQLKDEKIKSEFLSNPKNKSYHLSSPKESIASFKNHIVAENCLNYIVTINNYGSVENAMNNLANNGGYDFGQLEKQFEELNVNCSKYVGKAESDILAIIDDNLIESANLGNENASLKYALMLSQRAVYAKDLYTHQKRIEFHRKSIEILTKLSAKGHADSMLHLSMLLSDYVNFPETYDMDESRRQMDMYKSLTGKDMRK